MKVLLLSNMYPKVASSQLQYFGSFVEEQVIDLEKKGIEIIKCVRRDQNIISYLPFYLKSIFYLLFKDYDLIHAHYGFHSALPALFLKFRPLIVTFHRGDALDEPKRNLLYHWLQKSTVKKATHIIAVSNEIKEVLISQLGAQRHKISVISCGVDTSVFKSMDIKIRKELGLPEAKSIVLFVGSLSSRKGIDIVYKCANALPDVLFVLIGESEEKRKREVPPNCILVGAKPHYEIPKWLNAADIFLLPSRSEGVPVSLLEALSCGIPAITSSVGGIPDVMEDGKTGCVCEDGDEIIIKIKQLLSSSAQREIMSKYARAIMIKRFDNSIITDKIKKVYENL